MDTSVFCHLRTTRCVTYDVRAGDGRSVVRHRRRQSWRGLRRAGKPVMRLREPAYARLSQPERCRWNYQGLSTLNRPYVYHLGSRPRSGWWSPARASSRKRITGSAAGLQPLHDGRRSAEVMMDLGW